MRSVSCKLPVAKGRAGLISFPFGDLLSAWIILQLFSASAHAADPAAPVSFTRDIQPIFNGSCISCHSPEKKKGGLDLTSYKAMSAGGKEGLVVTPGKADKSTLIASVSGPEPAMPEKGEKLSPQQVELIARWVREGAKDDSPAVAALPPGMLEAAPTPPDKPPVYKALPVISAIAWSPDGQLIAVSGFHEVLLHKADGSGIAGRLIGSGARIESIVFSADGKYLAVSGGSPGVFGNVQIWDLADRKLWKNWKVSRDTVYGISFSPDASKVAFGCVDKTARVVSVAEGKELLRLDQHSDWCLGTLFTVDGKRVLTGSRDQSMKMSEVATGQFIDDINNPLEPVLSMARHPKQDLALYGGGLGTPRIYKIKDNQERTAGRNDTNLVKAFERQPSAVHAVAFSPEGGRIAVGSVGEARVYKTDGARVAALAGHDGAIFAIAFSPDGTKVVTGGYDGQVRIFDAAKGSLIKSVPVVDVGR